MVTGEGERGLRPPFFDFQEVREETDYVSWHNYNK